MGQLLVRNIDDEVKAALRDRAARHGRSMGAEARAIIVSVVRADRGKAEVGLGTLAARRFAKIGLRPGEKLEPLPAAGPMRSPFKKK
jgi:plasmid stability protein